MKFVISINNFAKYKWIEFSSQMAQSGWMDLKSKQTKSYIWYLTETHFSFEDTHMGSE